MEATEILMKEHENILKFIGKILEESNEKQINKQFFMQAIDFIQNYADKFHHAKEEEILFKEFCKSGNLHCNPVEQMLFEHEQGRKFVKGMAEGLKEDNTEKIVENARNYCQLLQEHIFKENNILYPMADEAIKDKNKKLIATKFKEIEKKNPLNKYQEILS